MSTKTSFKRIALVAASALAIAGFSAVPAANAGAGTWGGAFWSTATTTGPAATALSTKTAYYTANKVLVATGISAFTLNAGETFTPHFAPTSGTSGTDDSVTVTLVNYGNLITLDSVTASTSNVVTARGGTTGVITAPTTAGTYTLKATFRVQSATAPLSTFESSVTMTVVAGTTLSVPLSTAYLTSGSTAATSTTDATASSGSATAGTTGGKIQVKLFNADGTGVIEADGHTVSATVTGPGYINWLKTADNEGAATACTATPTYSAIIGRSITAQAADALGYFNICSDGTAGTTTVAVSVVSSAGVSTAIGTKTVTFYGAVASLSIAASNLTIGTAGGGTTGVAGTTGLTYATTSAFIVAAKSSDGIPADIAASGVPTIVSGTTTVVSSGTCAADTNATYGAGPVGYYGCKFVTASSAKSGDTATLTIRTADPADSTGLTYLTTTIVVTVGGSVAKEVISTNSDSYAPGAPMIITITATDSSGNPVADGTVSPAITGNKQQGGTLPIASTYTGGKMTSAVNAVFAPAIGGDFMLSATGTDTAKTVITATVAIDGDESSSLALDAANAATDAAENAYDEAQNATQAASDALAAVTALAKQVQSLIAQVKKLAKAVSKL